jgi:hypothetical protein
MDTLIWTAAALVAAAIIVAVIVAAVKARPAPEPIPTEFDLQRTALERDVSARLEATADAYQQARRPAEHRRPIPPRTSPQHWPDTTDPRLRAVRPRTSSRPTPVRPAIVPPGTFHPMYGRVPNPRLSSAADHETTSMPAVQPADGSWFAPNIPTLPPTGEVVVKMSPAEPPTAATHSTDTSSDSGPTGGGE